MKLNQLNLAAILLGLTLIFSACSSSDDEVLPGFDNQLMVLNPGAMIPMKTKVAITSTGTYSLPADANRLTTRCFGNVSVTIQRADQSPEVNSCGSADGSNNQTNIVSGLTEVFYTIEAGSGAEVTLN